MTGCTAKLETLSRTDEVVASGIDPTGRRTDTWTIIPDGVTVTRDGDRLLRADVTVLTCVRDAPHDPDVDRHFNGRTAWTDDTEGATPHRDPDPCPVCDGTGCEIDDSGVCDSCCPSCGGTKHDTSGPVFCPKGVWRCHPCPDCNDGKGTRVVRRGKHAGEFEPCPSCGGSGERMTPIQGDVGAHDVGPPPYPCPDCAGTGAQHYNGDGDCPSCGGSGTAPTCQCGTSPEDCWRWCDDRWSRCCPFCVHEEPIPRKKRAAPSDCGPHDEQGQPDVGHWMLCQSGTAPAVTDADLDAFGRATMGKWWDSDAPEMAGALEVLTDQYRVGLAAVFAARARTRQEKP